MPIEVRVLNAADEALVAATPPDVFDDPIDPAALALFLRDDRHHLIGALDGGALIGFVSALHYVHPDKPAPEFWLNEVGVAESHQGQGIAKRLMRETLTLAKTLGCNAAWVITGADNAAANALYAAMPGAAPMRDQVMYTFPLDD